MTLPYKEWKPKIGKNAWIAQGATVIGRTQMGEDSAVWFGCVVRGDVHYIKIGDRSNIQRFIQMKTNGYNFQFQLKKGKELIGSWNWAKFPLNLN